MSLFLGPCPERQSTHSEPGRMPGCKRLFRNLALPCASFQDYPSTLNGSEVLPLQHPKTMYGPVIGLLRPEGKAAFGPL